MNAVTPILTPYALENIALLQTLAERGGVDTQSELARTLDRDLSNLRRTLAKLTEEGFTTADDDKRPVLTDQGRRAVEAVARLADPADAAPPAAAPVGYVSLTAHDIAFDPANARQTSGLSPLDIEEMAASIREHGLLTPPIVRDRGNYLIKWGLVAGERRLRGWRLAIERGWIAADTAYLCQVFTGDDTTATEAALVENLQRVDLDNLEAAEGLRRLSDQADPPASAATIARRLGKEERWVEQRLKVAREATAPNKERYRAFLRRQAAPDYVAAADPDPYRWTDLRNSVQKPKHITALEKNPALAMLVVELAQASDREHGIWDHTVCVTSAADGGPVDEAIRHGLLTQWGQGFPDSVALQLTQLACDWLAAEGFGDDAALVLYNVRTAALGEIGRDSLPPRQYGTDFLNITPDTDAAQTDNPDRSPTLRPGLTGDAFSQQLRSLRAAEGEEGSEDEARSSSDPHPSPAHPSPEAPGSSPGQAEQGHPAADEAAQTNPGGATQGAAGALAPLSRLALLELAHAIATRGVTARGGSIRGAPLYEFHNHQAGTWGDLFRAKLAYPMQGGPGWIAVLTEAGQATVHSLAPRGVGRLYLTEHYESAGLTDNFSTNGALLYATPWLNPPTNAEPGSHDPSPASREKTIPPKGSDEGGASPGQPVTGDPIITGLRAAAADLWHAAREARAIFDDLFEREQSTEQMDAAARSLQAAQFALAPYLTTEQKAAR